MKLSNFTLNEEFSDDGGANGGGVSQLDDHTQDLGAENHFAGSGNADDGGQPDDGAQTAAPSFDMNAFATTLAAQLRPLMPQQQQQQQKLPSDEEFRKMTDYYAVSKQDVQELYGEPPDGVDAEKWYAARQSVMQRQLDGNSTHTMKVVKHMLDYVLGERLAPYNAMLTAHQAAEQDKWINGLAASNPALKGRETLVKQAVQILKSSGYQTRGDAEDRKAILMTAEQIGKQIDPNFSLQTRNGGNGGTPNRGKMPGAVNGAGGGSSGGGRSNGKSQIAQLFGGA